MAETSEWQLIHAYRRLVEDGSAQPLMCPRGDAPVVSLADDNYNPIFWCPSCDTKIRPGIEVFDQIKEAIKNAQD